MTTKDALILIIGIVLLITGSALAVSRRQFVREAITANGIVVELKFGTSHPKIEFTLPNNERIAYYQGGLITGYKVGDKLHVLYLESDPRGTACIDTLGAIWAGSIIIVIISFFLITVSLI